MNNEGKALGDDLAVMHQRIAELEKMLEISRDLTSALELKPLLRKILATAVDLTNGEAASILLQDSHTGELRFFAVFGADFIEEVVELDIPVPIEDSIAGVILTSREPLIVSNAQVDPRLYREVDQQVGFTSRSLLGVPLQIADRCVGVLEIVNKQNNQEFSPEDVETLAVLAAQATLAIENARLYEAVVDHAEQLEERVRERTIELQQRNEELAAYDHTVAHDLKNPLALVIGYAELLEEDYSAMPDEELEKHLCTITQYGHKMHSIIDELLLLSELRDMEVSMTPLDMMDIVLEAQQRLTAMIKEFSAEIVFPKTWPVAVGYGPWVEEIWANYLSNAIKYGGQPPRVELGAVELADGRVRFWIHDNGPGIPDEEQRRLFSRFSRLDQHRVEGHGLGLSIVQRIVEKLGGQVMVESELGQGSTFSFSLPGMMRESMEVQPNADLE